jgi:hypothetical protein
MHNEIKVLKQNNTWSPVPALPLNKEPLVKIECIGLNNN